MLPIARIVVLALVSALTLAVSVAACSDDTTGATTADLPTVIEDLAVGHDLTSPSD